VLEQRPLVEQPRVRRQQRIEVGRSGVGATMGNDTDPGVGDGAVVTLRHTMRDGDATDDERDLVLGVGRVDVLVQDEPGEQKVLASTRVTLAEQLICARSGA
jgi:hypothetical protein